MTRSVNSSKHSENHELEVNPDPEPSSSDLSELLSSDSRERQKKPTKKKKRRKHQKDDSSDPSLSDDSDSFDDSHYRRKRHKDKKHRKKDPIRESFQLQMGFSFPFLRANNLRTSLLMTRTRSLLYVGLFLNLIANAVNNPCFLLGMPSKIGMPKEL